MRARTPLRQPQLYRTLQELREAKGWSQKEAGAWLGVSQGTWWQYENGRHVPDELKMRLYEAGVAVETLLMGSPPTRIVYRKGHRPFKRLDEPVKPLEPPREDPRHE